MINELFRQIESGPLWLFVANRRMKPEEMLEVKHTIDNFIGSWTAHGAAVQAEVEIIDGTVVIVAADETKSDVTGCSKDKLYHLFQNLGFKLNLDFFNRMLIPVIVDTAIQLVHWNDIPNYVENGRLAASQLFFDGTVSDLSQFRIRGLLPVKNLLVAS